jgi:hypothetical protein
MNTNLVKSTIKKIKRACNKKWIRGQYITRINYSYQTIELLINNKDFSDNQSNNIIQILFKNGLFDIEILHQLLDNGHNINNINISGHGILASIFFENGDPFAKISWLLQNKCKYMFCKKQGSNWINDKEKNTEFILNILIELFLLKTIDRNILSKFSSTKRYIEILDIIDKYESIDEYVLNIIKTMIDNDIILKDLSRHNKMVNISYFLLFLMRDKIIDLEKIIKLNYNIKQFTGSSMLSPKNKLIIPNNCGVSKIRPFYISDNEISLLHNLIIQRCQKHKKIYIGLIKFLSTLDDQLILRILYKERDYDYYHRDGYNITESMKDSFEKYHNIELEYMKNSLANIKKLINIFKEFLN